MSTLFIIIGIVYLWLWYAMNVLHSPALAMLVYYTILCPVGGAILWKPTLNENLIVSRLITSHKRPWVFTLRWGVFCAAGVWVLFALTTYGYIDVKIIREGLATNGINGSNFIYYSLALVIINPVAEEYLWRYGVFSFFQTRFTELFALIISSMVFAGYHVLVLWSFISPIWLILVFLGISAGGMIFGDIYLKTRRLHFPIIAHSLTNLSVTILIWIYIASSTP